MNMRNFFKRIFKFLNFTFTRNMRAVKQVEVKKSLSIGSPNQCKQTGESSALKRRSLDNSGKNVR